MVYGTSSHRENENIVKENGLNEQLAMATGKQLEQISLWSIEALPLGKRSPWFSI